MIDPTLRSRVEAWRDDDPDPTSVAALDALLDAGDVGGLRQCFEVPLTFGTAGLRGPLRPGPGGMNRSVVRRTAAAIARWLDQSDLDGPVVVGRDARHGSADFADDTARVIAATGRPVVLCADPIPTPLLAFAVLDLGAAAGVMVTASHNPATDNGYKVYAAHGAQIAPPMDTEIATEIAGIDSVSSLPLAPLDDRLITPLPDGVRAGYLTSVAAARTSASAVDLRVAYTPMHGVGGRLLAEAFAVAGLAPPEIVAAQAEPDPEFPTVRFPNPEEPGAMDLVLALAEETDADLAIANDPDADRLAVAVPCVSGGWRTLTGDEVGALLADHLLRAGSGSDRLVATTVVSSSLLSRIAETHGVAFVETLTGFKWLAHAARERPGLRLALAYEEALGYCIGDAVHDKDGISAAVVVVEMVGALRDAGSSVAERLDDLARAHGLHLTAQWSNRFDGSTGVATMTARVDGLRASPPATLGGLRIESIDDLRTGERLPPTDAVVLRGNGLRVTVRPSGTEPKLKAYVEVVAPVTGRVAAARGLAESRLADVLADVAALLG
ncbi:MAG: phospho-sugar mutase [Acidimicrobiales bacterium]|nr:phospho-sugar mutase [Acidimicrobiales bacterium]